MQKCSKSDFRSLTLFAAITLLAMSAVLPAFADNGSNSPGASTVPNPVSQGNPTNIRFEESGQAPHKSLGGIYVFSPTAVGNIVDATVTKCPMPVSTSGDYWVLLTNPGGLVINYFIADTVLNNGMVSVPFGTGAPVVITPSNSAKVGPGDASTGSLVAIPAQWHKLTNTAIQGSELPVQPATQNTDNTNNLGAYTAISCGVETTTLTGLYQTPVDFNVNKPVGGEIMSVNTVALVIAGLTTSGIWMVPAIASVAGVGISIYKFQKNN